MDLPHAIWKKTYLTYKNQIFGFAAPEKQLSVIEQIDDWLAEQSSIIRAYVACVSVKLFTQKATTLSEADILAIPYPETATFDLSYNERIVVDDIVEYYRDLIRLGEKSVVLKNPGKETLPAFCSVFARQINSIYKKNPLRILEPQAWAGVICQPFVFGKCVVDWSGVADLQGRLDVLLRDQRLSSLHITRIAQYMTGLSFSC